MNALKTLILLAFFPVLLLVTFWGVLASILLMISGTLALTDYTITFPWPLATTDIVPQMFWQSWHLGPPLDARAAMTLPANNITLLHVWPSLLTDMTVAAAPYLMGFALLWLVIAFRYEDTIITAMGGARGIARSEFPALYEALEEVCEKARISQPKLHLLRIVPPNAYATGLSQHSYAITVTAGLLARLDHEETKAVLAHELSHIKHGDVRLLVVATIITGIFGWMAGTLWRYVVHSLMGYNTRYNTLVVSIPFVAVLAFMLSLGGILSEFVKRLLLREREMGADAGAVAITGNASAMASALMQIVSDKHRLMLPPALRDMVIYTPPERGFMGWWRGLWSTHPSMRKRLVRLAALGAGPYKRGPALVKLVISE